MFSLGKNTFAHQKEVNNRMDNHMENKTVANPPDNKKRGMDKKKVKKILNIVGNILLWGFVAFTVFFTIYVSSAKTDPNTGVKDVFGKSQIFILTKSMEPKIKEGDIIYIDLLEIDKTNALKVGDVIMFMANLDGDEAGTYEQNTHRIHELYYNDAGVHIGYYTKGDNNPDPDKEPVLFRDIIGVWTGSRIPVIGGFLEWISKPTGFMIVIVLPLVFLFLFELYRFISIITSYRAKKVGITAADEEAIKQAAIAEYLKQQNAANKDDGSDSK